MGVFSEIDDSSEQKKCVDRAISNWPEYSKLMTAAFTKKGPPPTITATGDMDVLCDDDNKELWAMRDGIDENGIEEA